MSYRSKLTPAERVRLRTELYAILGGVCPYCHTEMAYHECTLDHVTSLASGGRDDITNLVVCCEPCNVTKRNAPPGQFMPELNEDIESNQKLRRESAKRAHTIRDRFSNQPFAGLSQLLS